MPSKKKSKKCTICQKNSSLKFADMYCSSKCLDEGLEYHKIIISKLFVNRINLHLRSIEEKQKELVKFAQRHNYNLRLVCQKIENEFNINLRKERMLYET